ncbi:hypothetical protein GOP47_0007654 [Adiantum capillus-veneris]|uniref:Pentatricopeptide repeat-containing protein n=1 Tax=Adiantum capillus-veneris TaxID=13818 RepID=A0A9D4ZM59_ADICA|nr:hypothetical protein GOP47_0007654 [Adiantum capillus-veneris]
MRSARLLGALRYGSSSSLIFRRAHSIPATPKTDPSSSLCSSSSKSVSGLRKEACLSSSLCWVKEAAPGEALFPSSISSIRQLETAIDSFSGLPSPPSSDTLLFLLKACLRLKSLPQAKRILACIFHHRIQLSGFLGDYLVVTLAKCGAATEAWKLSCTLPCRTIFSWSAIISVHVDHGDHSEALKLYQCMQEENVHPNKFTLVSLFKACGFLSNLTQGKKLHEYARRMGLASDAFVGLGIREVTSVIALQACGILAEKEVFEEQRIKVKSLALARALHADAVVEGYASRLMVGNTLVSAYGKCKSIADAEHAFCAMSMRDVVSWNAMLSAYIERSEGRKALQLYCQMQVENTEPEHVTFIMLLQACAAIAKKEETSFMNGQPIKPIALEVANSLHMDSLRRGFASDMIVASTLLDVYGKCGSVPLAEDVFSKLPQRNAVSWTALLFAYVEQKQVDKALIFYMKMKEERVCLDAVALVSLLQACRECGSLELCKYLHFNVVSSGFDSISGMQTTLVYTYGSCASMGDAQTSFDGLLSPDIMLWSACIDGHASEGNSAKSLHLFENFILGGRKPDEILLASVLSACCYSGHLAMGLEYFSLMDKDFGLTPNLKHFGILIDLLGRAGDLRRTENMLKNMPMKADLAIWVSVLGACRTHGNVQLARHAFNHAISLQPERETSYVLISNIYADAGMQDCVSEVERIRQRQGAWDNKWLEME